MLDIKKKYYYQRRVNTSGGAGGRGEKQTGHLPRAAPLKATNAP